MMTAKEILEKVKEEKKRSLTRVKDKATSNSDFLDNLLWGLEEIREETSFFWGRDWLFKKRYAPFELRRGENSITISFGKGKRIFCTFIADEFFDISCSDKVSREADDDINDVVASSNTLNIRSSGSISVALELIMRVLVKFEERSANEDLKD